MWFQFPTLDNLQLDIVGIVAILGEDAVRRSIQVSCLSWWNVLPRLMPAPQALVRPEKPEGGLPFDLMQGKLVNTQSGTRKDSLNFFCSVLHPVDLPKFSVEFVEVTVDPDELPRFSIRTVTPTMILALSGTCISITLIGLAVYWQDGFAFIATLLLSFASSALGLASRWTLQAGRIRPKKLLFDLPMAELVIFYPEQGSFRIVHCDAKIASQYIATDRSEMLLSDSIRRTYSLIGIFLLIVGLICLGNAGIDMKIAFTASYVLLNLTYWGAAIQNPLTSYWKHNMQSYTKRIQTETMDSLTSDDEEGDVFVADYKVAQKIYRRMMPWMADNKREPLKKLEPTLPWALWQAIALTSNTDWIASLEVLPDNPVWTQWIVDAEAVAHDPAFQSRQAHARDTDDVMLIPEWNCQGHLSELFRAAVAAKRELYPKPPVVMSRKACTPNSKRSRTGRLSKLAISKSRSRNYTNNKLYTAPEAVTARRSNNLEAHPSSSDSEEKASRASDLC